MDELENLQKQIADLQKKAAELALQKRIPIIEELKNKIKLYGITAKELGFAEKSGASSTKTSTVPVKYRQGDLTWTGRGKRPRFIVDYLAGGGKIEDLLVQ